MNISFELKKTSAVSQQEEEILNYYFADSFNMMLPCKHYFSWKYRQNPFGESLHLFARVNGDFAGCRSFWNLGFLDSALQCVDTFTNTRFRGLGVFKLGTEYLLKSHDFKFYNAPNPVSEKQYLKNGWRISSVLKPKITLTSKLYCHAPEIKWNADQLRWRYKDHPFFNYMQTAIRDKHFIFRIKKGVPVLLGYATTDPKLARIQQPRRMLSAYYGNFPGIALEFGGLTKVLINGFDIPAIDSYWFDMF